MVVGRDCCRACFLARRHGATSPSRVLDRESPSCPLPHNLSPDPDNAFFTDGVQDESNLADLAKITRSESDQPHLRVASAEPVARNACAKDQRTGSWALPMAVEEQRAACRQHKMSG